MAFDDPVDLQAVVRLSKDLREAAETITAHEARFLVDAYYAMQKMRIVQNNRMHAMEAEPHAVLSWLGNNSSFLEKQVQAALDRYSNSNEVGKWMRGVTGIGPVIAAGFLAHIDIRRAPTVGHIWRFAGLDPTLEWKKGEKRPYNASLKTLCWKLGESFKKLSNHPNCVYGRIYRERKSFEVERNERGYSREVAEIAMKTRNLTDEQKVHYGAGKLPPGRLDLRSTRYAVKHFLSDLHHVWYRIELKKEPPKPFAIAILGHGHERGLLHPM